MHVKSVLLFVVVVTLATAADSDHNQEQMLNRALFQKLYAARMAHRRGEGITRTPDYPNKGTVQNNHAAIQKLLANQEKIAQILADSCSAHCQSGGYGDGVIIGTAPFCGGSCAEDCPNTQCYYGTTNWADYGAGCWTGNKVCCCALG